MAMFVQDRLCDGIRDCQDGSDEMDHCHCYQLGEASCAATGRCINRQKVYIDTVCTYKVFCTVDKPNFLYR
jgi:hypothetical protein